MKTIKTIMTTLLTILCACKGPAITPQINADINFKFNRCRLRCYDFKEVDIAPDYKCNKFYKRGDIPQNFPTYFRVATAQNGNDYLKFIPGNYPIEACDKITGFFLEDFAKKIKPEAVRLKEYYQDIQ